MPETRSMATDQKPQRLLQQQKGNEEHIDRLVEERNNLQCEVRNLKAGNDSLKLSLANTRCLYDELMIDNEQKQALIDKLKEENDKQEATVDRVYLLEQQLREAHNSLNQLQTNKNIQESLHACSLHNELSFANFNHTSVRLGDEPSFTEESSIVAEVEQSELFCEDVNKKMSNKTSRLVHTRLKLFKALNDLKTLKKQLKKHQKHQHKKVKRVALLQEIELLKSNCASLKKHYEDNEKQRNDIPDQCTSQKLQKIKRKCTELMALLESEVIDSKTVSEEKSMLAHNDTVDQSDSALHLFIRFIN